MKWSFLYLCCFCLSCHLLAGIGAVVYPVERLRAAWVGEALTSFGPLEMTASDILPFSKSIVAPVFSIKSMPIKPAVLVGIEHKMGS